MAAAATDAPLLIRSPRTQETHPKEDRAGEPEDPKQEEAAIEHDRNEILMRIDSWLETPMVVLGFVWLGLLIWEFIWGLGGGLNTLVQVIWIIFIVNFLIEFILAPRKLRYLRRNWLTAVSLLVPALRALRFVRILRAARGIKLVRVLSSFNRGMRGLGSSFSRRGFGYVVALTVTATLAGAAGMFAFENEVSGGLHSYGEALWWTSMLMTTLGSGYWPQTVEGRVLCVILALYAFAVFGYVTATLATFFMGQEAAEQRLMHASDRTLSDLRDEIAALRAEIGGISGAIGAMPRADGLSDDRS